MGQIIHGTWQKELLKIKENSIDLIIIDPPYITTQQKWDKEESVDLELAKQLFRIAKPTSSLYVWCGIGEKSQSLIRWFPVFAEVWKFKDLVTWKKQRGIGMRKGWLYTREEIMWFVKDNKEFVWKKEEQWDKTRKDTFGHSKTRNEKYGFEPFLRLTNVWTDIIEIHNGNPHKIKKDKIEKGLTHYTPKPIKALERIILSHTNENDTVLDCFLGSGTTVQACKNTNRNYIGIEKELEYYNYCKKHE